MITSKVIYKGGLRTECTHTLSGQTIITDAPPDNHGKGESFSPTDLAATSLATCLITVTNIAAESRGIAIQEMSAEVTKIMSANPRKISEIIMDVYIKAENISAAQQEALEHIGRNCPVALSLHPELKQTIRFHFNK
jgi:putative redox protein